MYTVVSRLFNLFIVFVLVSSLVSCSKKLEKEVVVYKNDFESGGLSNISDGAISDYNGSKVLGFYSKSGFLLSLKGLPNHNLLKVSFDLNIHGDWKGHKKSGSVDSADVWIMNFDDHNELYTSFSNLTCSGNLCNFQSYPASFPFSNNPAMANAALTGLPGLCAKQSTTTKYRITRTVYHDWDFINLGCFGQPNLSQSSGSNCDPKWSIDNIKISVVQSN